MKAAATAASTGAAAMFAADTAAAAARPAAAAAATAKAAVAATAAAAATVSDTAAAAITAAAAEATAAVAGIKTASAPRERCPTPTPAVPATRPSCRYSSIRRRKRRSGAGDGAEKAATPDGRRPGQRRRLGHETRDGNGKNGHAMTKTRR